jgi:nitroreductase/NAD-dependent dihydropyrimidine dehydrogenase PreA subunit
MKISVDEIKCKMCLKCISECPTKSLTRIENKINQVDPAVCLACGHCAAVCMHDALSWDADTTTRTFSLPVSPGDMSGITGIFRKTRSIRKFKSDKIDRETLRKIILHAEMAPSCDNFRNREYIIVDDPESIDKMEALLANHYTNLVRFLPPIMIKAISLYSKVLASEINFVKYLIVSYRKRKLEKEHLVLRDAPCILFIVGPKKSMFAKDDCIAAQNYLRLSATAMGLGSCIIGFAQESNGLIEKHLGVDKNKKIYAATILGFQANEYFKSVTYAGPSIIWK